MKLSRLLFLLAPFVLIAAPLLLRPKPEPPAKQRVVIITPHGEQIRYEYGRAFAAWARREKGILVDIDWRAPGGTSDIIKFLDSQYAAKVAGLPGHFHSRALAAFNSDKAPDPKPGDPPDLADQHRRVREAFLKSDYGVEHDIFFGGGEAPHRGLANKGYLVNAGLLEKYPAWFTREVLPQSMSGETMYDPKGRYYGACLSVFGVCANPDRLRILQPSAKPSQWRELGEPRFQGSITFADPTKSGVVVTCLERIIQQEMNLARGDSKAAATTEELSRGWDAAWALVKRMSANARFITDGASRAARDVVKGDASAGFAIDFHARSEADWSAKESGGEPRLVFHEPIGGTSVSADPIGLLRGGPNPELAKDFIAFVMSPEGQKLWNYKIGEPGGTTRYALRRLPIRRDAYTPENRKHMSDPEVDPYKLAASFTYRREWTAPVYGLIAPLTKAVCLDALVECQAAWAAILRAGGPQKVPKAARAFEWMPVSYADGKNVLAELNRDSVSRLKLLREWTVASRGHFAEAKKLAEAGE